MKRIFLTGGGGFIGRNIIELLSDAYLIDSPGHKQLDLTDAERVMEYFKKNGPYDVVIHGAEKPGHRNAKGRSDIFLTNMRMLYGLMRCEPHFGKLLFLSSGGAYGIGHLRPRIKESDYDLYVPDDESGLSKYATAKLLPYLKRAFGLRLFGVFGKYEDYSIRFVSNMICKAVFDLPLTIKQNKRMDYLYIDDFIKILTFYIENDPKELIRNVTPDMTYELKELAEMVKDVSGKDLPIVIKEQGMGEEYSGDNTRLKTEVRGLKFEDIKESIKKLYAWYEANKSSIKKELLLVDK